MGDPRKRKALQRDPRIMPHRNQSTTNPNDGHNIQDENPRRTRFQELQNEPEAFRPVTRSPGALGPATVPDKPGEPPKPVDVPDRYHKWSNNYVRVEKDHRPGEDTPTNAGYRLGAASTIADGYAKAVELASKLDDGSRVTLLIGAGIWKESLHTTSTLVDIQGKGRATHIRGNLTVGAATYEIEVSHLRVESLTATEAVTLLANPPTYNFHVDSNILLHDVEMFGPVRALVAHRRFTGWNNRAWQTTLIDPIDEIPVAEFRLQPTDVSPTDLYTSRIWGYMAGHQSGYPASLQPMASESWAVKATAKINFFNTEYGGYNRGTANTNPTGGTLNNFVQKYTGVRFLDCHINGALLNEGWTVQHVGGTQRGGRPFSGYGWRPGIEFVLPGQSRSDGLAYCTNRGWTLVNTSDGAYGQIPAETFFDNTRTYSDVVCRFVMDGDQTLGFTYGWAGNLFYRNSLHGAHKDGSPQSPLLHVSGAGWGEIVNSPTACQDWLATSLVVTVTDSPIQVPIGTMRDPFMLQ